MSDLTFSAKGHRYELDGKPVTGVTTVLGIIAKPMLLPWAARMTAEWIRENCHEDETVRGDKPLRYLVHESDLQEAVTAHTKKKEAGGQKGTDLHSVVEKYIKDCITGPNRSSRPDISNAYVVGGADGLSVFASWAVTSRVRFLASEQQVYSREWWCAGTFDFSFEKDGKRFIGDLKTMKKMWDRVPFFQTAAYMKMSEEMGEPKYDGSCIVNIAKETHELTEHWTYDHENDKKAFEAALVLYRQLSNF